jgi:hypothetical protein
MTKTLALCFMIAALLCGAASSAGGLEIEGNFQLGNLGFTSTRASTDSAFAGTDYFWGGSLSVRQDVSSAIQVNAALTRDLIVGNSISALLQYKSDYFRVGMGPYLGLVNSSGSTLKSGISTLLGAEIPGIAFLTLRTDSALGGQASTTGDYFAQSNELLLGFSIRDSAICTLGLRYEQFSSTPDAVEVIDSLTVYSFDVKVFEKNVPYRLDFNFAYQALLRQYLDNITNPSHGLDSVIAGIGVDLIISPYFAFTLGFRASVWTFGVGVLSGLSDIGFAPFLFQGSAGFRVSLPDPEAPAG